MPRIQTTPTVRLALVGLRIYLVVMLLLIIAKFAGSCAAAHQPVTALAVSTNAAPVAVSTNAPAQP